MPAGPGGAGAHGAGGVLVPINTRFKGEEAAYVLERSGAETLVVVTDFLDQDYLGMLAAAAPDSAVLRPGLVAVASGKAEADHLGWDEFLAAGTTVPILVAEAAIDAVTSQTLSDMMFTSGTTGNPKVSCSATVSRRGRTAGWPRSWTSGRGPLSDRPAVLPHFGYKAGWMACIVHGVTALPGVFATRSWRPSSREGLDPPGSADALSGGPRPPDRGLRPVLPASDDRVGDVGAAGAHPPHPRASSAPEVTMNAYGLTEATSLATTTFPSRQIDDVVRFRRPRRLAVELRVVDASGTRCPAGAGRTVQPRLERDAGLLGGTRADRRGDRPRRLAALRRRRRDGRARFRPHHRPPKDVVFVGGFNVYPAEVERCWPSIPGGAVAVVGDTRRSAGRNPGRLRRPRRTGGRSHSGSDRRVGRLAGWPNFKAPRRVVFVESLPRNASMKVLKNELRAAAQQLR